MNIRKFIAAVIIPLFVLASVMVPAQATGQALGYTAQPVTGPRATLQANAEPLMKVTVDPRAELFGIISRFAGNPEYRADKFKAYISDIDAHFGKFRDHPVMQLIRQSREKGVCCDAIMNLAFHVTAPPELKERLPFENSSLDKRWQPAEARAIIEAARAFAKESDFESFFRKHQATYQLVEGRMQKLIKEQVDLEWFPKFFGKRPQARFIVSIGLLTGHFNYGTTFRSADKSEELHAVLGALQMDQGGVPVFDAVTASTVVHEFNHSFINYVTEKHMATLQPAGEVIYAPVVDEMRRQGYGRWQTVIDESLVRAAVARYMLAHQDARAAAREVGLQTGMGFLWMNEVFTLLGVYENTRSLHPTFESFFPYVTAYFSDLAPRLSVKVEQRDARYPKVASMTPANGSKDVDPGLTEIRITFDRPMDRINRAVVYDPKKDQLPEISEQKFDEAGTVFTLKVKLKPNWSYEFSLNSPDVPGFRSPEGLALKPYEIRFQTGPAKQ